MTVVGRPSLDWGQSLVRSRTKSLGLARPALALGLALVGALGVLMLFFTGPVARDDLDWYFYAARTWPVQMNNAGARFLVMAPLRALGELTDYNWRVLAVPPILSTLTSLALVWLYARRHVSRRAGWLAFGALLFTPFYLARATVCEADLLGGTLALIGLVVAAPALLSADTRRAGMMALIGGFLMGMSFAAKESSVLAIAGCGAFVLLRRRRAWWAWRSFVLVSLGGLLWLGVEMGLGQTLVGDPLWHLRLLENCGARGNDTIGGDLSAGQLVHHWTAYLRMMADPNGPFRIWGWIYLAVMVWALRSRRDALLLILCCLAVIGGYLSAGSITLSDYLPVAPRSRYTLPLIPLASILVGAAVDRLLGCGRAWKVTTVAACLVLLLFSIRWTNWEAGRIYNAPTFQAGVLLAERQRPPWPPNARLLASRRTEMTLRASFVTAKQPPILVIPDDDQPASGRQWQERYGGAFVIVGAIDRWSECHADDATRGSFLGTAAREALRGFPVVQAVAPRSDRINTVLSSLGLADEALAQSARVEVYWIPPASSAGETRHRE